MTTLKPQDIAKIHSVMVSDKATTASSELVKKVAKKTAKNAHELHAKNQQVAQAIIKQPMLIGGKEKLNQLHIDASNALDTNIQSINTGAKLAAEFAVKTGMKAGGVLPITLNDHLAAVKAQLDLTLSKNYQAVANAKATVSAPKSDNIDISRAKRRL